MGVTLTIIVSAVLFVQYIIALELFLFCKDKFTVSSPVQMPNLADLKENNAVLNKRYEEQIINKATDYFEFQDKLHKAKLSDYDFSGANANFVGLCVCMLMHSTYLFIDSEISNSRLQLFLFLLALIICSVIICFIHYFRLRKNDLFDFELAKNAYNDTLFCHHYSFIDDDRRLNIYLMLCHFKYLKSIEKMVLRREKLPDCFEYFAFGFLFGPLALVFYICILIQKLIAFSRKKSNKRSY